MGNTFPPLTPTTLTKVLPSYLYQQYADDDSLQAFVSAFNQLAQQYVDYFANLGLPIYTGPLIQGALLDWVAQGLYGLTRPAIPSGSNQNIGPFNTYTFNRLPINGDIGIGPQNYAITTDDIFKRILTWLFFKGDGKVFNIRWLKRRIERFLNGANGVNYNVSSTYQVSVTFGADNVVNIQILNGTYRTIKGALFNKMGFNKQKLDQVNIAYVSYIPIANVAIFKQAIESGFLELPFQFTYNVII